MPDFLTRSFRTALLQTEGESVEAAPAAAAQAAAATAGDPATETTVPRSRSRNRNSFARTSDFLNITTAAAAEDYRRPTASPPAVPPIAHWHCNARAMPRNIARLRYRLPPAPVSFEGIRPTQVRTLEKRVAQYVVRQSNPRHLRVQTVVNPKAKPLATAQTAVRPIKPYTLRDVVDPEGTTKHGQVIYVFRSIKTNQIIYSLQELLDVRQHYLAHITPMLTV